MSGLIKFPRLGSIPFRPEIPLPRMRFIKTVSALSLLLCAVAILVQLVTYADMRLVIGETAAILAGGIIYLTLIVRAGAWNSSKKESEVISRDLLVSAVTSLVFTVPFFFIALRYSVRNEFQLSIAFFGIIFIISFVVLRALAAISSRHRK